MSFSTGVNRVLLIGHIGAELHWEVVSGQRMLCFKLSTTEKIKKDGAAYEHIEWHGIKMPPELVRDGPEPQPGDLVYLQGKLQTRMVFENNTKLYKTEVLVTSFEKLKFSKDVLEILK
jgi:single-stranded DNA-binding protein